MAKQIAAVLTLLALSCGAGGAWAEDEIVIKKERPRVPAGYVRPLDKEGKFFSSIGNDPQEKPHKRRKTIREVNGLSGQVVNPLPRQ
jgi:hypothetical protein